MLRLLVAATAVFGLVHMTDQSASVPEKGARRDAAATGGASRCRLLSTP